MKIMRKTIIQILLILLFAISIPAQSAEQEEPELLDEFGSLNLDELMSRLDYFAFMVLKKYFVKMKHKS